MTDPAAMNKLSMLFIICCAVVACHRHEQSASIDCYRTMGDSAMSDLERVDCRPVYQGSQASFEDPLEAYGRYLMLGPWADPIEDLRNPALEMIIGKSMVMVNFRACGVGFVVPISDEKTSFIEDGIVDMACHPKAAFDFEDAETTR